MLVGELREVLEGFHPLDPVEGDIERDPYTGACVVVGVEQTPEFDVDECPAVHLAEASDHELLDELSSSREGAELAAAATPVGELSLAELVDWVCLRFREQDAGAGAWGVRPVVDTKPLS